MDGFFDRLLEWLPEPATASQNAASESDKTIYEWL